MVQFRSLFMAHSAQEKRSHLPKQQKLLSPMHQKMYRYDFWSAHIPTGEPCIYVVITIDSGQSYLNWSRENRHSYCVIAEIS